MENANILRESGAENPKRIVGLTLPDRPQTPGPPRPPASPLAPEPHISVTNHTAPLIVQRCERCWFEAGRGVLPADRGIATIGICTPGAAH
jgi:hypothetical protein